MSQFSLTSLCFLLVFGLFSPSSFSKEITVSDSSVPLHEDPVFLERYEEQDEEETNSFFGDFFSDEPGDPIDFEQYYGMARMAFLFGYYDTALQYWQPMADLGYAKAQASIGWMYHSGKGYKQDYKRAFQWYAKAANQNHAIAQNNLGVLYEKGWGVRRNLKKAAKWYKESAEWGYSYGQFNYGKLLQDGRGVKKNTNEAIYWLDLASLQGVKQASQLLGRKIDVPVSHQLTSLKKETWIMLKNPRYYTLQLKQANSKKDLEKYIEKSKITGQFAYYIEEKNGKIIYNLIYGVFTSYTQAEKKMKSMAGLNKMPWIRKFINIQTTLKKKNKEISLKTKTRKKK